MAQESVTPAKTSPAPTNAGRPRKAGWTSTPRAVPSTTSDPAAIRTCRSSEIAFLPRTTDSPARSQASVPPSTLITLENPAAWNFSHARRPRLPERQIRYRGSSLFPLRASMIALGSRASSGTRRAGSAWTSRYSTAVRTSIRSTASPRRRNSSTPSGVIVGTLISPSSVPCHPADRTGSRLEIGVALSALLADDLDGPRGDRADARQQVLLADRLLPHRVLARHEPHALLDQGLDRLGVVGPGLLDQPD